MFSKVLGYEELCALFFSASCCNVVSCSSRNLSSSYNISSIIDWIFPFSDHLFIPVPNKKVQTLSNLEHLGNTANELQLLRRVKKNIVEKGEDPGYLHFLPFPATFSKMFLPTMDCVGKKLKIFRTFLRDNIRARKDVTCEIEIMTINSNSIARYL